MRENDGQQFGRLPATAADRGVADRPTREAVVAFWRDRYGIPAATWDDYTFWERGAGKLWAFRGSLSSPVRIEGLGMAVLRADHDHWKPTTNAAQRFGHLATDCVIDLTRPQAERFVAGEDQDLPAWDGDWGYLIATHELAGERAPIGVGLYLRGELRSQVPKGRRREL